MPHPWSDLPSFPLSTVHTLVLSAPPPFRPRAAKFDFTLIIACAQLDMSHEVLNLLSAKVIP